MWLFPGLGCIRLWVLLMVDSWRVYRPLPCRNRFHTLLHLQTRNRKHTRAVPLPRDILQPAEKSTGIRCCYLCRRGEVAKQVEVWNTWRRESGYRLGQWQGWERRILLWHWTRTWSWTHRGLLTPVTMMKWAGDERVRAGVFFLLWFRSMLLHYSGWLDWIFLSKCMHLLRKTLKTMSPPYHMIRHSKFKNMLSMI